MVSATKITIGGAGGIGSFLCQWLVRQRPQLITIYDHDTYEEVNSGSQLMMNSHIGANKAEVAVELALEMSQYYEVYSRGKYEPGRAVAPYTFACFDNIDARRMMFVKWLENNTNELFIDGRLLMESFEIFTIPRSDQARIAEYEKWLFKDEEIEEAACTMKATTHCGAMIAAMMVGQFNNYLANKAFGEEVNALPFHIRYDIALCNFEYDTYDPDNKA